MNILHITEIGVRANGIGTVIDRLYKEQTNLNHNVKITSTERNLAYKHLPLYYTPNVTDLEDMLKYWSPDVVLFHSIWIIQYIPMAKLLRKKGIPYGVMMHGANSKENIKKGFLKKKVANALWFNSFLNKASGIIYLSEKELENCVSKGLNDKNYIMPNGCEMVDVDIDNIYIHKPINIVYLGRLVLHHKGIDYLLDALDILAKKESNDFHVTFYGNENDIDILEIKKRLKKLITIAHYAGPVYGKEKANVYKEADMFILTSRFEGMPMAVLEALSYGVPCLLTPGTNMSSDVMNSYAGWETLCDAETIARDIERAIAELKVNYKKIHQAAYNLSKNYDWKLIAKQSIEILQTIRNK